MNVISFLSKLVVVILMIFTVACTNEEGVNNNPKENNKETTPDATFIGGIDIDTKAKSATRTSLDITYPGGFSVKYFGKRAIRFGQLTVRAARRKLRPNLLLHALNYQRDILLLPWMYIILDREPQRTIK